MFKGQLRTLRRPQARGDAHQKLLKILKAWLPLKVPGSETPEMAQAYVSKLMLEATRSQTPVITQ